MRFYRILDTGTSSGDNPLVAITSITNGASLSGQVTIIVKATSDLQIVTTALYVNGQQMDSSDDGSNYGINTCEWLNGPHVLYATAKAESTLSGPSGPYPIQIGRGVSPFVQVSFNNLISEVAFSQPFFLPSLGQTQQVTANFAANVNWTLQIMDDSSNVVRTATGGGSSLSFNWDGNGDGGTSIPDGVYDYHIYAQTNGQPLVVGGGSGGSGTGTPPVPDSAFASLALVTPELWAISGDGSGTPVPLILYPPGFDTNGMVIFSASPSEVYVAQESSSVEQLSPMSGGFAPMGTGAGYSGPSAQGTTAPTRPPTSPEKNPPAMSVLHSSPT